MAASGFTPISLYYSTTASAVPTSGNLANGELGLNIADMKLYAKNSAGTVTLLASNAASATVGTSILYGNGSGGFSNVTIGSGVSFAGGTLSATGSGGSVTSVAVSGGTTGLTTSGGPITTSGTITLAGTLGVANGGTGLTSLTAGRIPYGAGTSALGNSSIFIFDGTNFGVGAAPISTVRQYIRGTGSTSATWSLYIDNSTPANIFSVRDDGNVGIGVSSGASKLDVYGTIRATLAADPNYFGLFLNSGGATQIDARGTGATLQLLTAGATRFLVGPSGQLGIGGATYGTSGQVLTSGGSGAAPTWSTIAAGAPAQAFVAFGSTGGF
jgi:hypothetical protein